MAVKSGTAVAGVLTLLAPPTGALSEKPSIFAAVQERLGLKLESQRGSVTALVIDHVERPTAN